MRPNFPMDTTWEHLILLSLCETTKTFSGFRWYRLLVIEHLHGGSSSILLVTFLGHRVWSSFQFGKSLLFIESKVRLEGAPCVGEARQRECLLPVQRGLNPTPSTVLTATTATGLRTDVWRNKQCLRTLLFEVGIGRSRNIKKENWGKKNCGHFSFPSLYRE